MPCCRLSHTDPQGGVELSMEVMKPLMYIYRCGGHKVGSDTAPRPPPTP